MTVRIFVGAMIACLALTGPVEAGPHARRHRTPTPTATPRPTRTPTARRLLVRRRRQASTGPYSNPHSYARAADGDAHPHRYAEAHTDPLADYAADLFTNTESPRVVRRPCQWRRRRLGRRMGTPWRTLGYAFSRLRPGDTLFLRGGTYFESLSSSRIQAPKSQPIVIRSYPGETAVIDSGYREFRTPGNADWELVERQPASTAPCGAPAPDTSMRTSRESPATRTKGSSSSRTSPPRDFARRRTSTSTPIRLSTSGRERSRTRMDVSTSGWRRPRTYAMPSRVTAWFSRRRMRILATTPSSSRRLRGR